MALIVSIGLLNNIVCGEREIDPSVIRREEDAINFVNEGFYVHPQLNNKNLTFNNMKRCMLINNYLANLRLAQI